MPRMARVALAFVSVALALAFVSGRIVSPRDYVPRPSRGAVQRPSTVEAVRGVRRAAAAASAVGPTAVEDGQPRAAMGSGAVVPGLGPTAEVRGTWISTYSCSADAAQMASCVQYLHTLGANTVYVDAWHDGVAYFDSPTMRGLVGDDGVGADLAGWALAAARPLGMQVVAWLEYGLIAAPAGATSPFQVVAQQRGWISGTADGFQWLDAGNKAVLRFMCSLVADARRGYPQLQAVQLDDHFAAPVGLPGASVATMTAAARAVSHNVSLTPGPPLTLAPATLEFALQQYNVDWAQWHQLGLFARFTPQIYRLTSAEFEAELTHTVTTLGTTVNLVAGIRASGSPETSWPQLAAMLSACEAAGVGQVVWDVRAVIGVYAAHFQQVWRPLPATVVSSA